MIDWIIKNHEVVRDAATPIVTIVVGIAAIFVQVHFNRRQAVIAEDKLKFDLFKERYGIYLAANEMVQFLNSSKEEPGDEKKFRELFTRLEQAHFFFDDETCTFLSEIMRAGTAFMSLPNEGDDVEARMKRKELHLSCNFLRLRASSRYGASASRAALNRSPSPSAI